MKTLLTIIFLLTACAITIAQEANSPLSLRGYIKDMPALQLSKEFDDPQFSNTLHNRLNFRWDIAEGFSFTAEGRNRLIYNELIGDFPQVVDMLKEDDGLIDMSWVWLHENAWVGHSMVDRLYLDWRAESWHIRLGRQRINWGVTMVSNPNDLFNTYSFFDIDYPERPGADALRVQHHFGMMSSVQLAVSPGREIEESVAATMVNLNRWGYDFQALAGYYYDRLAMGGGWAGHIKGAGFKGEATWFYDLNETPDIDRGNLVAAVGFDYIFPSGVFGLVEVLYNGGYGRTGELDAVMMITQPLRADNIMFSEYAVTLSIQHQLSGILSGSLAVMALPDIEAVAFMPSVDISLIPNLDMEFTAQLFAGGSGGIFEQAGHSLYMGLRYSF